MNFLLNVMKASLYISKTVSAVGAVIVIGYGIHQFVKETRRESKQAHDRGVGRSQSK